MLFEKYISQEEIYSGVGSTPEQRLIWAILETFIRDYIDLCKRMTFEIETFGNILPESRRMRHVLKKQVLSPWCHDMCDWVDYHPKKLHRTMQKIEARYGIHLIDPAFKPEYSSRPKQK